MSFLARSFPKQPPVSVIAKLVAGFSAFVSIAILWYLKEAYPVLFSNTLLASMGATAVLLFATPHSTLAELFKIVVASTRNFILTMRLSQTAPDSGTPRS